MSISYAVIALTQSQAQQLAAELGQTGDPLSAWLQEHARARYGNLPDDWKPFNAQPIEELLTTNPPVYVSQSVLVQSVINSNFRNLYGGLLNAGVEVYFIDGLATLLPSYLRLAERSDAFLAAKKKCVLILAGLPADVQAGVRAQCESTWSSIHEAYRGGERHRITGDLQDFLNFTNQLKQLPEYANPLPSPVLLNLLTNFFQAAPKMNPQIA